MTFLSHEQAERDCLLSWLPAQGPAFWVPAPMPKGHPLHPLSPRGTPDVSSGGGPSALPHATFPTRPSTGLRTAAGPFPGGSAPSAPGEDGHPHTARGRRRAGSPESPESPSLSCRPISCSATGPQGDGRASSQPDPAPIPALPAPRHCRASVSPSVTGDSSRVVRRMGTRRGQHPLRAGSSECRLCCRSLRMRQTSRPTSPRRC